MLEIEKKINTLIDNLTSSIQPIQKYIPLNFKNIRDNQQLPDFLKIGNLIGESENTYPALLSLKELTGIAFKLNDSNTEEVHLAIQDFVLQIIEGSNKDCIEISVVDTVKMGANFRNLRNLSGDYLNDFVASEINLKDFIEKQFNKSVSIISECLSNFENLSEYNNKSGAIQPFRIIVIADFPNISDIEKLNTLVRNAKESGIFFFISYSTDINDIPKNKIKSYNEILDKLLCLEENGNPANDYYSRSIENSIDKQIVNLLYDGKLNEAIQYISKNDYANRDKPNEKIKQVIVDYSIIDSSYKLQLDRNDISSDRLNNRINNLSKKSIDVIEDYTTGLKIPIGKMGGKTFHLTFGNDSDNFHAIIGGQSGKGKTVLLNNIVARGIEKYDSNELQFVIIDCSGTGFYEFENSNYIQELKRSTNVDELYTSVENLEQELNKREILFQENSVSDLKQYVSKTNKKLPRLVVLIDEFHILYTGTHRQVPYFDKVLVDKIIRVGRKFGIHLIVCTQSLGGGVRRSILDNIPLRIALGMTSDQSNSFLGLKNDSATNLEKGVAIYNSKNGSISANKKVKINLIEGKDINTILSLK